LGGGRVGEPGLIVVDGLQWAAEATVLLLRDLALRINSSRMVVLGTYWESELDSGRPFATTLSRLLKRRRAHRIVLGRLSDHDVERVAAGLAEMPLTPVQLVGIQAATEGNPPCGAHDLWYLAASERILGGPARAQS